MVGLMVGPGMARLAVKNKKAYWVNICTCQKNLSDYRAATRCCRGLDATVRLNPDLVDATAQAVTVLGLNAMLIEEEGCNYSLPVAWEIDTLLVSW